MQKIKNLKELISIMVIYYVKCSIKRRKKIVFIQNFLRYWNEKFILNNKGLKFGDFLIINKF